MRTTFLKNAFLVVLLVASIKGFTQSLPVKESALVGCWTDSREENAGSVAIYRPCNYKEFPVSRFRFKMELAKKGKCRYLYLAPNDAHTMVDGSWTFNTQSGLLEIVDLQGKTVQKFKVISLKKDLVEIEKEK